MQDPEKTILSIQSHVTHGYVGNKAAVFPLQLHGFDVDAINTVSLSNHSGYPVIRGHRMDKDEFLTILEGMRANGFLSAADNSSSSSYRYLLTGYVNNAGVMEAIGDLVRELRGAGPGADAGPARTLGRALTFVCDPVMGDDGRLYCSDEVISVYKRALLPLADVATPNYFEASVLSGVEVVDRASARRAAAVFHGSFGIPVVIIKSFPHAAAGTTADGHPSALEFLVSCCHDCSRAAAEGDSGDDQVTVRFAGTVPFHPGRYTGTGDVFAAEFTAFFHEEKAARGLVGAAAAANGAAAGSAEERELFFEAAAAATAKAMAVLQDLILATKRSAAAAAAGDDIRSRELRVTCSASALLKPETQIDVSRDSN